jgi:hypothetical protein
MLIVVHVECSPFRRTKQTKLGHFVCTIGCNVALEREWPNWEGQMDGIIAGQYSHFGIQNSVTISFKKIWKRTNARPCVFIKSTSNWDK